MVPSLVFPVLSALSLHTERKNFQMSFHMAIQVFLRAQTHLNLDFFQKHMELQSAMIPSSPRSILIFKRFLRKSNPTPSHCLQQRTSSAHGCTMTSTIRWLQADQSQALEVMTKRS